MQNKNRNKTILYTYGGMLLGVVIGCILFGIVTYSGYFLWLDEGLETFHFSAVLEISSHELGAHLFKRRCLNLIIFILTVFLTTYACTAFCFCTYFGVYYGYVLCDLIIKYGINGYCYGISCFFPHYLFYFILIFVIGKWKIQSLNNYYGNINKWNYIIKIIVIIILFLLAFGWEWKIQKFFLNYFFQHLV